MCLFMGIIHMVRDILCVESMWEYVWKDPYHFIACGYKKTENTWKTTNDEQPWGTKIIKWKDT